MFRLSVLGAIALTTLAMTTPAEAQRRTAAPISQGATSMQIAEDVAELRIANAELSAKVIGLESDKTSLNGKIETLEFLLSQSRDEINRMQGDDAEIERLISQLEKRLTTQDQRIKVLENQLGDLQSQSFDAYTDSTVGSPTQTSQIGNAPSEESATTTTTSGPTRIVRRTVTTTTGPTQTTGATSTAAGGSASLPQGSLGTLPASALPGEAGPLFAEAKSRLLQFDYSGAELAFRSFLDQFSDDPQAGEAQYWLAEVLYQQEAYAESGQAYTTMIRSYPDDPRAPEALAKLARSMRLVGDTEQACNALNLLPQRYPNASGVTKNLAAGERVRSACDS